MSTSNLSPPGSSTYDSSTMSVGDGTWDSSRNDFLLPNLQGLNLATTQYNGMGNRFRNQTGYYNLILGHAILGVVVFVFIVPTAAFVAKFYTANPRRAIKLHVNLQILTVFLTTAILVTGWFAVGPERSLTNPHHGIGVAIYVWVLAQFIYGWLMARIEKRRKNPEALIRTPTKVWLHKLFGRSVAILGFIQIALGLTLYGSPKWTFVVYALTGAFLLLLYIGLDRRYYEKRPLYFGINGGPEFYSDYGSYLSGSGVESRPGYGRPPSRDRERSHWGRNALAAVGAVGAYEAFQRRRSGRRDDRTADMRTEITETEAERRERMEQEEMDAERRRRPGPPGAVAAGAMPPSRPGSRPPPGVEYGAGNVATGMRPDRPPSSAMTPARMRRTEEESRLSPESWEEDEKYSKSPRHTWRDRILGAGAGIAAFEGARRLFSGRNRREDDYVDEKYRPPLGGAHNMVNQSDVSRVEAGQAPFSPDDPRRRERMNMAGVQPMTPTATPSRRPRMPRPSADSFYNSDEESVLRPGQQPLPPQEEESHTLRNSIASLGAIAGFREWNRRRRERRGDQRMSQMRRDEIAAENYNRHSASYYPRPQDAQGRRPSIGNTVTSGTDLHDTGFAGSNPQLSRTSFAPRPDTNQPPFPVSAGPVPLTSPSPPRLNEPYNLPPPPPGPPPAGLTHEGLPGPPPGPPPIGRSQEYIPPAPGTLQMPQGAVNPDPSRLVPYENVHSTSVGAPTAAALFGAAAGDLASGRRRTSQSESPSGLDSSRQDSRSRLQRRDRRNSITSGSVSNINTNIPPESGQMQSPPVAVKVRMHNDDKGHVTVRRLSEEEAARERAARRAERRNRRRRSSEISSGGIEDDLPPGSNQRYRRRMERRSSADQPITNVPPPPPMSSAGGSHLQQAMRDSAPNPPPLPAQQQALPGASANTETFRPSPPGAGLGASPPVMAGSGMTSPGDAGTGTDVSAFADNRRRRRAERQRRLEAARGTGGGNRVEFE